MNDLEKNFSEPNETLHCHMYLHQKVLQKENLKTQILNFHVKKQILKMEILIMISQKVNLNQHKAIIIKQR